MNKIFNPYLAGFAVLVIALSGLFATEAILNGDPKLRDSTVRIYAGMHPNHIMTAFYIGDGKFVTSAHGPMEFGNLYVMRTEDLSKQWGARIVAIDNDYDIAILQTLGDVDIPPLTVSCDGPKLGEFYKSYGYAGALPPIRQGHLEVISILDKYQTGIDKFLKNAFFLSGIVLPGQSGSPITDQHNNVVGVMAANNRFPIPVTPELTLYNFSNIGIASSSKNICSLKDRYAQVLENEEAN